MLTSFVGVVVLLGGLIFFHEAGHYLIAKLFKVKVEVFSLGFGKKIFRRQVGETEYALSLIPLGGYVKLMGDDPSQGVPPEDSARAFSTQKLYKRFCIVAAGPIFNLLLAYALFMAVFWFGQPVTSSKIGNVVIGSPAWEAGFRNGDRVVQVAGVPVQTWNELEESLKTRTGEKVEIGFKRGNEDLRLSYSVGKVKGRSVYGEEEEVGGIDGIQPHPIEPMVGISAVTSPAYQAGLRTGDIITKVGTRPIAVWDDLKDALAKEYAAEKPITLSVKRGTLGKTPATDLTVTFTFPKGISPGEGSQPFGILPSLGIYPSELFVGKITPGSPAEKGGLQPEDRIVKVGDKAILSFEAIVDLVQDAGKKQEVAALTLERQGQHVVLNLKPVEHEREDPLTRETIRQYIVGFSPLKALHEADTIKIIYRDPVELVSKAVSETNLLAKRMLVSLGKLVTGSISVKNLGGPVLIASVAGKSLDAGIIPFLQMMALISINLFLLNLFPIPVLDGGHLLFFLIEAVQGKPVSIRTMEIANQVGMVLILMLVGLTFFNDISRIVLH